MEILLRGDVLDDGKSQQTSWMYQCMVSGCSGTFELLTDLQMHFLVKHQSGNQFCVQCHDRLRQKGEASCSFLPANSLSDSGIFFLKRR